MFGLEPAIPVKTHVCARAGKPLVQRLINVTGKRIIDILSFGFSQSMRMHARQCLMQNLMHARQLWSMQMHARQSSIINGNSNACKTVVNENACKTMVNGIACKTLVNTNACKTMVNAIAC